MEVIKDFLWRLFRKFSHRRCEEQHCWLTAENRLKGHYFCDMHYHDHTYDIGITGKGL